MKRVNVKERIEDGQAKEKSEEKKSPDHFHGNEKNKKKDKIIKNKSTATNSKNEICERE